MYLTNSEVVTDNIDLRDFAECGKVQVNSHGPDARQSSSGSVTV